MTRIVEFHILENASQMQAWNYACKQIEKMHQAKQTVYVHTDNLSDANKIDTLLWTFREDSFVPHDILQANKNTQAPIHIGYSELTSEHQHSIVNLGTHIPANHSTCQHLTEIVSSDPSLQQLARERFKQYRDQGCEIKTIKVKNL